MTEPTDDPHDIARLAREGSKHVTGRHVDTVPLGWSPLTLPFRRPERLTIGAPSLPAALYLREVGVPGFVELVSRRSGPEGAEVSVTARATGPASFDFEIGVAPARFESAREAVSGRPLSASTDEHLVPGPIGVLEAKAAGIQATVLRERAWPAPTEDHNS